MIFLLLPIPFLLFEPVSISLGYMMDSFQTFPRLFIQEDVVSARGSRQNTPALHAKTQGATRAQQFACKRFEPYRECMGVTAPPPPQGNQYPC